jgi:hypothetical protein
MTHWKGDDVQNSFWHSENEVQDFEPEALSLVRHASETVLHVGPFDRQVPSND